MSPSSDHRLVYFYTHTPIVPFKSGMHIRQFTNVRAYRDLGYTVKVIHIRGNLEENNVILPDGTEYYPIRREVSSQGWRQRVAYKLGFPFTDILQILYPDRQAILRAVNENEQTTPGAIHHFEYSGTANVAISLRSKKLNLVWSCLDWESDRSKKVADMREEAGRHKPEKERMRRQKYAREVERRIADSCKLVLMIAQHETKIFQEQLNIRNAELLPMSWPDEIMPARQRDWVQRGTLRMLHVGSPDAMVGYYSLKFILGEVFPQIPEHLLGCMELWVAGKMQNTPYSQTVLELAQRYPKVKFLGYVENIQSLYSQCDIHLVGNSVSTGLRTRIIESFVCGIPVISTYTSAEGIVGLKPDSNILLEDTPDTFARRLISILMNPGILPGLANHGRDLYDRFYCKEVESSTLHNLLEKYIFRH